MPSSRPRSPRSARSEASRPGPSVPSRWPATVSSVASEVWPSISSTSSASSARHPHEPAVGGAQHEAQVPLVRLEPLELRPAPDPRRPHRGLHVRDGAEHDRRAGKRLVRPRLDLELEVAELDRVARAQRALPGEPLPVDERSVGRAGVLDCGPLGLDHDPRVVARDRVALQADEVLVAAAEGQRHRERIAAAVPDDEVERLPAPRDRGAANGADGVRAGDLAAAATAEHVTGVSGTSTTGSARRRRAAGSGWRNRRARRGRSSRCRRCSCRPA